MREDYNSEGLVGNFLRQKAELKTTSMVAQDSLNEKTETLDHLYGEIGSVNKKISEMELKYIEYYMSLDKMMNEIEKKRDLLHQTRAEDDHVNCAPVLKSMQMESLILATEKQMKARSDVLSLLEKHQMEKKAVSDALLKLEKEMGNEQKLNLEIAELEEQLKVLKCVNSEEADHENKRKIEIEEIEEKLEDMNFYMFVKDDENQALKKVQEAKTELEDARQQIINLLAVGTVLSQLMLSVQKLIECIYLTIQELPQFLKGVTKIQIKKFGEEVIDENDPKLLSLKNDLGEEAYVAVVTDLKELHEYDNSNDAENTHNSIEKQVIPEIWDSQNGRRATVTEALKYISNRVIKMR
ncbi:factor of DNA methylation 1-like [Glycine max]|uniref:factor of DNA methylation 1-like n=1 Tax=Glycine max TaxID=3847 RepID=UPI001B355F42|nr:factor of DNA methylation 1-like [Glycine max]